MLVARGVFQGVGDGLAGRRGDRLLLVGRRVASVVDHVHRQGQARGERMVAFGTLDGMAHPPFE